MELNRTLQYKVPINSINYQNDPRAAASQNTLNISKGHMSNKGGIGLQPVYKQGKIDYIYVLIYVDEKVKSKNRGRDRTPNVSSSNRVIFEEPDDIE